MGKSYNAKTLAGQGKNDARKNHILAIIEKYTASSAGGGKGSCNC